VKNNRGWKEKISESAKAVKAYVLVTDVGIPGMGRWLRNAGMRVVLVPKHLDVEEVKVPSERAQT
jgi:carbamoylphosphate synthase small subunit